MSEENGVEITAKRTFAVSFDGFTSKEILAGAAGLVPAEIVGDLEAGGYTEPLGAAVDTPAPDAPEPDAPARRGRRSKAEIAAAEAAAVVDEQPTEPAEVIQE